EGRRQSQHEAELPLGAPLVLPQVTDQVADDQQVNRPEQMDAPEHGLVKVEPPASDDEAGVEEGEQHRDDERGGEPPAHADAQDDEDVEREERARSAFGE